MLRALLLTAFAASSSLAFVSRAPLPKLAPRAAPARPTPLMMPAFLKKVGFSKPIPRTGVKKAVHWLGSTLALPGLAMATLAVATPPPDAMVQLESFTKVWQRFVPALTYKFLAIVGVVKVLSVLAMNGVLRYRGESLETSGNVALAAVCLAGACTHGALGEPFLHSIALAAMFLANAFVLE